MSAKNKKPETVVAAPEIFYPDFSEVNVGAAIVKQVFACYTAPTPIASGSPRRAAFNTVTRTETPLPAKYARQALGVLAALESFGGGKVAVNALVAKCENGEGFVLTGQSGKRIFEFYRKDMEKRGLIVCE